MTEQKTLEQIEKEFRATIILPQEKPAKQIFFCPVGLVGAGKTTVTKPISEQFHLVRVSSDELRKLLKDNGYDYSPVKDITFRIIKDLIAQRYSISFDMDCGNPLVKQFVEPEAAESGACVFFVHINPPQEFVFEKFRNYPLELSWLAPGRPEVMIENYLAQKETRLKENTHFGFFYTFDTSKADIGDQIKYCAEKMELALKQ